MIKNHKVERKERLLVAIDFKFPDPHHRKSYVDKRRHFTMKVDINSPVTIDNECIVHQSLRLRALVIIKKMFGNKIDSSFTYRVGENFGMLRIGDNSLRIALSFSESNVLEVLDNSSHILQSRILENVKNREDGDSSEE